MTPRAPFHAALVTAVVLAFVFPAPVFAQITSLTLYSDPADPVGQGVNRVFGPAEIYYTPVEENWIIFTIFPLDGSYPYELHMRAADRSRIVAGVYEGTSGVMHPTIGTHTLEIFQFSSCSFVTGRFEVKEATYDDNGALLSFDAYFTEQCGFDQHAGITGEIRWNAHPPIDVSVPLSVTAREGELSAFLALSSHGTNVSYSIQGLPLGATFADVGDNAATFKWTPDFAAAGDSTGGIYSMRLTAASEDGASLSIPLRWNILDVSLPPVADAGGPYEGVAGFPVAFDGTGSFDPDGGPLYYEWVFGDGSGALFQTKPFHTYSSPGEYQVLLYVQDGQGLSNIDSTTASIHAIVPARLFTARGNRDIRLTSGKPTWCVQIEPIRSSFNASDVVMSTVVLVSDSTSGPVSHIPAIAGKSSLTSDTDGNGIDEATACFAKGDLLQLFAYVSGRSVERVAVEGSFANGNRFRAAMQIEVVGPNDKTALAATPNPLNPETELSWYLPRASTIRLRIFDVSGRLVATLADGPASAGHGSVRWRPRSDLIASGVYYANLETETDRRTLRLVVLK